MKRTLQWLLSLAVLFTVSPSSNLRAQTDAERLEAPRSALAAPAQASSLTPEAD